MANFMDRIQAGWRAFKMGEGAMMGPKGTGHDDSIFSPVEYGDYLVTSNTVYTCATLRADALTIPPLRAYKWEDDKKVRIASGEVVKLLNKVNDFWTMNRLLSMSELSLCLWGRNYWFVERGESTRGKPREIWWAKPSQVKVHPDPEKYIKGFEYFPTSGGRSIWFEPHEVVWFRYPNPLDQFSGLSPIAAARLAADLANGASQSNLNLYKQGYQMGGVVTPPKGITLTPEQGRELEAKIDERFKGVDKAHRWGVLRFEAEMKSMAVTPKDAEYLGSLNWSVEEIARAYKVPLDMIGGQRTYENVKASDRAFWMRCMMPETIFLASEIVEQFLPMFGATAPDLVDFDIAAVPALKDDEAVEWTREEGQIKNGAITINEWRVSKSMDPVAWGDAWWGNVAILGPITTSEPPERPFEDSGGNGDDEGERSFTPGSMRLIEYGGAEHERLWRKFERRAAKWEKQVGAVVADLFKRQQDSILDKMKAGENGTGKNTIEDPFSKPEWIKRFRETIRPVLGELVADVGAAEMEDLETMIDGERSGRADEPLGLSFDVQNPSVIRFIERQAQRFAVEVNDTTWQLLKLSLNDGIKEGEAIIKLMARVREVMGIRIQSSEETIARTEVIRGMNGGTYEAWKQSEIVAGKSWLAALDDRTRDSHIQAHRTYQNEPIPIDDNFQVGSGSGPHPGAIGVADEDINCRCTMRPVIIDEFRSGAVGGNHHPTAAATLKQMEQLTEMSKKLNRLNLEAVHE